MVSVCLPSDALLQHLLSYLGFSYLGRGVSLHSCSSKAQPLFLTLDEGYLLTAAPPDLGQVSCIVGRCFTVWATKEVCHFLSDLQVEISSSDPSSEFQISTDTYSTSSLGYLRDNTDSACPIPRPKPGPFMLSTYSVLTPKKLFKPETSDSSMTLFFFSFSGANPSSSLLSVI